MPRYDLIYRNLAERAVAEGGLDVQALFRQAEAAGIAPSIFQETLLRDLEEGGPIFGKFFRSLAGAAEASVSAAGRQGEVAGIVDGDAELQRLVGISRGGTGSIIRSADPELLGALEDRVGDNLAVTWIAELVNTCHRCLPLHGTTRTLSQWRELGLHPDTIHAGWVSACKCRLVPGEQAAKQADLVAPLKRLKAKSPTGLKASRRTARAVSQVDLDKSVKARNDAMQSLEGRRTLRLLGQTRSADAQRVADFVEENPTP